MINSLTERMKEYEAVTRIYLPEKEPMIVRVDGAHFHTFLKNFRKPFDHLFAKSMNNTMWELCRIIPGCVLGYTQSDEITFVVLNDLNEDSQTWFGGNVAKIVSTTAALATLKFNQVLMEYATIYQDEYSAFEDIPEISQADIYCEAVAAGATFDARVFNVPKEEITNVVYWRQADAIRNSVNMMGFAYFSPKEMHGKNTDEVKEMLREIGHDWDEIPLRFQRGSCCIRKPNPGEKRSHWTVDEEIPVFLGEGREYVERRINYQ